MPEEVPRGPAAAEGEALLVCRAELTRDIKLCFVREVAEVVRRRMDNLQNLRHVNKDVYRILRDKLIAQNDRLAPLHPLATRHGECGDDGNWFFVSRSGNESTATDWLKRLVTNTYKSIEKDFGPPEKWTPSVLQSMESSAHASHEESPLGQHEVRFVWKRKRRRRDNDDRRVALDQGENVGDLSFVSDLRDAGRLRLEESLTKALGKAGADDSAVAQPEQQEGQSGQGELGSGRERKRSLLGACQEGRNGLAAQLLDEGANTQAATELEAAPLVVACEGGHGGGAKLLPEKGVKIEAQGESARASQHAPSHGCGRDDAFKRNDGTSATKHGEPEARTLLVHRPELTRDIKLCFVRNVADVVRIREDNVLKSKHRNTDVYQFIRDKIIAESEQVAPLLSDCSSNGNWYFESLAGKESTVRDWLKRSIVNAFTVIEKQFGPPERWEPSVLEEIKSSAIAAAAAAAAAVPAHREVRFVWKSKKRKRNADDDRRALTSSTTKAESTLSRNSSTSPAARPSAGRQDNSALGLLVAAMETSIVADRAPTERRERGQQQQQQQQQLAGPVSARAAAQAAPRNKPGHSTIASTMAGLESLLNNLEALQTLAACPRHPLVVLCEDITAKVLGLRKGSSASSLTSQHDNHPDHDGSS